MMAVRSVTLLGLPIAIFTIGAIASDTARAEDDALFGDYLRVQKAETISAEELWNLGSDQVVCRAQLPAIIYKIFDYEDRPADGDWVAHGILMVGGGDIAEKPVVVRVWIKRERYLQMRAVPTEETGDCSGVIEVQSGRDCEEGPGCATQTARIRAARAGQFYIDDRFIGEVRYP